MNPLVTYTAVSVEAANGRAIATVDLRLPDGTFITTQCPVSRALAAEIKTLMERIADEATTVDLVLCGDQDSGDHMPVGTDGATADQCDVRDVHPQSAGQPAPCGEENEL